VLRLSAHLDKSRALRMDVTDDRQYNYFFLVFCSFNNTVTLGYKVGLKKNSYLFTVPLFLTPPLGQLYPHRVTHHLSTP
jgi:hypothetical protein